MSSDSELDAALGRLGIPADATPIATPEAILGRARAGMPPARTRWPLVTGGLGLLAAGLLVGILIGRATAPEPTPPLAQLPLPLASAPLAMNADAPNAGAQDVEAQDAGAQDAGAQDAGAQDALAQGGQVPADRPWRRPAGAALRNDAPMLAAPAREAELPPEASEVAPVGEAGLAAPATKPLAEVEPDAEPDEFASIPEDAPVSEERQLPVRELLGLEDALAVGNGAREIEVNAPQGGARAALRVHAGAVRAPYSEPGGAGGTAGLGVGYRFELEGPWTATLSADALAMGWEAPTQLGLAFGAQGAAGMLLGRGVVRPGLAVRAAVTSPLPESELTTPRAPPALQLGPALLAELGPAQASHLRLELGVEGQTPLARREEPWTFGPNASLALVVPI